MSDNDATRRRRRVADPLRSFVEGSFVYDLKAGGHFDEKSLWEIVDGLKKVADEIDREHERRMEQCRHETKRAFAKYLRQITAEYERDHKRKSWVAQQRMQLELDVLKLKEGMGQ